ncbi:hypothetical protein O181_079704 [Austropuccinia psidii MF-1]|uniref:Uncharacterized protein n=1 Tax=Austropuccinia psidii MF-1 TaxID=1389203 RepID=A0A9Q3FJF3_9BASI|nr:hypothetical protein [Austropuccinia psidii MF-1]
MEPISNGYFNFSSGHQGTSSRGFINAQIKVSISNTNEAIKKSLVILIHSIPPREYWQFILKGYSRGSSKTIFQVSVLHQSNLATTFIEYSLDSSRPVFSFIHTSWEDHSTQSISQFGKVYIPPTINTASSIQYRPASSLKESSSQTSHIPASFDPGWFSPS